MRRFLATALTLATITANAPAAEWHLANDQLIDATGEAPSLWGKTIAYTDGQGGAVMYFDGSTSHYIYGPSSNGWEPANAHGSIAWRNSFVSGDQGSNDILRWNGVFPVAVQNVSNSAGVLDADLDAAGNGDLIWSRNNLSLRYYDASASSVLTLGINGVQPSVYVTDTGVATYAWQDPSTDEVWYFDGSVTHDLGPGDDDGAHPHVWDGAVAWIGEGVGMFFTESEVFFWKNGQTTRVTNDDGVGGIADLDPQVWNDRVLWSRRAEGPFNPSQLYIWDGVETTKLTSTTGRTPSFHNGHVAWVDLDGLHLAAVVGPGDCNEDGHLDYADLGNFVGCLTGPEAAMHSGCDCFDLDDNQAIDLADFAEIQRLFAD